jgi:hypothetical protein
MSIFFTIYFAHFLAIETLKNHFIFEFRQLKEKVGVHQRERRFPPSFSSTWRCKKMAIIPKNI